MRVFTDKIVVVRKEHKCSWCHEIIEKGDSVPYRSYVWEDGIVSEWMHPECNEAMYQMPSEDMTDGYCPGEYKRGSVDYK